MNDKTGFDIIDKGFQEDLEKEAKRIRAELEAEISKGEHPKFSQSDTDWMLAKFPYVDTQQRTRAVSAEMEKRNRNQEVFDAEIEKRMVQSRAILEQLHFGKDGRQYALEQVEREKKEEAFKKKQQEHQEQKKLTQQQMVEKDQARQNRPASEFNNATKENNNIVDEEGIAESSKERKAPYAKDEFNIAHSASEINQWQERKSEDRLVYDSDVVEVSINSTDQDEDGDGDNELSATLSERTTKEEAFKERMRERLNEQGNELEPEI